MEKAISRPETQKTKLIMPKTSNHFRVIFEDFGTDMNNHHLSTQVVWLTRPSFMDKEWKPIEIVLRDDIDNVVQNEVIIQIRKKSLGNSFRMRIQMMDGSTNVLDEFVLTYCNIIEYVPSDLVYESAAPSTIRLLIEYKFLLDNYLHRFPRN